MKFGQTRMQYSLLTASLPTLGLLTFSCMGDFPMIKYIPPYFPILTLIMEVFSKFKPVSVVEIYLPYFDTKSIRLGRHASIVQLPDGCTTKSLQTMVFLLTLAARTGLQRNCAYELRSPRPNLVHICLGSTEFQLYRMRACILTRQLTSSYRSKMGSTVHWKARSSGLICLGRLWG